MSTTFITAIVFFVFAPILIIYLEGKYKVVKKIGAVLICYGLGILLGNIGLVPRGSAEYIEMLKGAVNLPLDQMKELVASGQLSEGDKLRNTVSFLQDQFSVISIMLCLPLILFSLDVKKWFSVAREAFLSLAIGLFTVLLMVFVCW